MQKSSDIIIIGGGIIGLSCAWMLRKQGLSVIVFDQQKVGLEASWAAGGILSSLQPWTESESVNKLAEYSQEHYASFCYELMEKSGVDAEWQQTGMFFTEDTVPDSAGGWFKREGLAKERLVDIKDCFGKNYKGVSGSGYFLLSAAQLKPPALLLSLKIALEMAKVNLIENAHVDTVIQHGNRVVGVKVSNKTYTADKVLICTGAWSKRMCPELEVVPMKGEMLSIQPDENYQLKHILLDKGKYCIPRLDGKFVVGSTLQDSGFEQAVTQEAKTLLLDWARKFLPDISEKHIQSHWSGLRPKPNREFPIITKSDRLEGLYYSTGHFRNGILLALGSARLITDLICGKETFMAIDKFAL